MKAQQQCPGISCRHADMQPWRGTEAFHRVEGKQGMHQQISTEESSKAGREKRASPKRDYWLD